MTTTEGEAMRQESAQDINAAMKALTAFSRDGNAKKAMAIYRLIRTPENQTSGL